jgi:REP element-mobilizing transposase RayT
MDEYESLSHSKWECKYHVVFIPKCRRRTLYGEPRPHPGEIFRKWRCKRKAESKKAISCRITFT